MNSTVSLQQVFPDASFFHCVDLVVDSACADSRSVRAGDVFFALAGTNSDGHSHIQSAIAAGAMGIVAERPIPELSVPQCIVSSSRAAFARVTMIRRAGMQVPISIAGVTGTNGKTTTTWLLHSILRAAGLRTGLIGTIANHDGVTANPASMTTPAPETLAEFVSGMMSHNTTHCAMEISSHALHQQRCAGLQLSAAAVTNITQDHFDYHGTRENYHAAKAQIAELLHADAPLLININDAGAAGIPFKVSSHTNVITFAVGNDTAELSADLLNTTHRSQRIRLKLAQGDAEVRLRLIGYHNVENALAAAGLAEQLGIRLQDIVTGLESVLAVPGRLERIDAGQPFQVLVDYAHTPDAIAHVVRTLRKCVPGRVLVVFGAGGQRDELKRPLMGKAAVSADVCILTSDNPRAESPNQIMDQIQQGMASPTQMLREPDRRRAIELAFELAEPGDAVLIAGKGHETTQEVEGTLFDFDDRQVARELLSQSPYSAELPDLQPVFSLPRSA